jgi:hypothetical protein
MNSKEDFNKKITELVGNKIIRVYYSQINYPVNQPYWNDLRSEFDCLDFGLVIEFDDKLFYKIYWDDEYYQFGISCKKIENISDSKFSKIWDVSFNDKWKDLLNKKIIDIKVYWDIAQQNNENIEYPQDLELVFDNDEHIYISASYYNREDDEFLGFSDEIVVIFDKDIANKYHIGPFRNMAV